MGLTILFLIPFIYLILKGVCLLIKELLILFAHTSVGSYILEIIKDLSVTLIFAIAFGLLISA